MKRYAVLAVLFSLFLSPYAAAGQNTQPTLTAGTFGVAWVDNVGTLRVYNDGDVTVPMPGVKMYAILAADLMDTGEDQLIFLDDARKALHLFDVTNGTQWGPFGHSVKTMAMGRCAAEAPKFSLLACTFDGSAYRWTKDVMGDAWIGVPGAFSQASAGRFDRRSDLDDFAVVAEGNVYSYSPKWNTYAKMVEGKNIVAVLAGDFTASPGDEIAILDRDGQVFLCQNKTVESLNQEAVCLAVGRNDGGLDTLYAVDRAGKIHAYRRETKTWTQLTSDGDPVFKNIVARQNGDGKGHTLYTVSRGDGLYRIAPGKQAEACAADIPLAVTLSADGKPLARYRYAEVPFKPYVDELYTPKGRNVLRDAPYDHLHHHALMFATWAGGVNFWEEHTPQAGRQQTLDLTSPDNSLQSKLAWQNADGKTLLTETREIHVAEADGATVLDWQTELTAPEATQLGEKNAGHYHGLGMRFDQTMDKDGRFFSDSDANDSEIVRGDERLTHCQWMAYTAKLDGKPVTVALFDHPANPIPMFAFTMGDAGTSFAYLSAALNLHREPIPMPAEKPLTLRYRVVVWEGETSREAIQKAYGAYAQ